MLYRELKSYKFELAQTYQIQTEIFPEKQIVESYVGLGVDGLHAASVKINKLQNK